MGEWFKVNLATGRVCSPCKAGGVFLQCMADTSTSESGKSTKTSGTEGACWAVTRTELVHGAAKVSPRIPPTSCPPGQAGLPRVALHLLLQVVLKLI